MTNENRGGINFPSLLLIFVIFIGAVFLIPNGVEGRVQRVANFDFAVFLAISIFVMMRINIYLGILLVYISAWIFLGSIPLTELYLILACVLVYVFICVKKINKTYIYNAICIFALLNVAWQILQVLGIYWITYPQKGAESMYVGLMGNPNDLSCYLAVSLPAFFRGKWNKVSWLHGIPFILLGIFLAKSMVGVFAICVVGLTYLKLDKKSIAFVVIGIVLVCGFAKYENFMLSRQINSRVMIWNRSIDFAKEKPFGWGIGQYAFIMSLTKSFNYLSDNSRKVLYAGINDKDGFVAVVNKLKAKNTDYFKISDSNLWTRAHNEYIEIWFALGMVGLLLCTVFAGNHLIYGWKMEDRIPFNGLLASLATATVFFSYHIMPLIILTVVYMGFIGRENVNFGKLQLHK